jgi:hypothetical protein
VAVEEEKAPEPKMKRANSKFSLGAGDNEDKVLYRPEFGATQKDANEKIWELMSSYIGSD